MSGGILGGLLGTGGAQMGTGLLGNLAQSLSDNSGLLMGYGASGFDGALQGMQQDERIRLIRQKEAEEAQRKIAAQQAAQKLGIDPVLAQASPELIGTVAARKYAPKEYGIEETYLRNLQQTDPDRFKQIMDAKVGGGGGQYSLSPVYGTDANGNPVIMQMNSRGGAAPVQLPQGVTLSKEPIKMDAGTHFVLIDPITRQQVGVIPKDIAGEAAARKQGEARGTEAAGAQQALDTANQTIKEIDELRAHPGREIATGGSSWLPSLPGTNKKNFDVRVAQLKGKTFLQAYQSMKGTGAISEAEGKKAEEAIARLDQAQSEGEFVKALDDLEGIVKLGAQRLQARTGASPTSAGAPTTPQRRRYNPQTGELE